jgi:hypothetical protein
LDIMTFRLASLPSAKILRLSILLHGNQGP